MANSITLGTLVTRCKQRGNAVGSDQIETAEWKELISEVYGELHGIVSETGARYFETEATVNLGSLALPSDHLSTVGVDFVIDAAGRRRELAQLMVQERTLFAGVTCQAYLFALVGGNLALYPTPSTGTYKHIYVPQPTDYSTAADATSVDTITTHGARFIIWGAAAIALHRSESAQQRALEERAAALEKVMDWAISRAITMPKRRIVTETDFGDLGYTGLNGAWNPASWLYR